MSISSIRRRLLQAEESFLAASREHLMGDFEYTWNTLTMDIMKATSAHQMTEEDIALAYAVLSRIVSMCKPFVEFMTACDEIRPSFEQDLERILEEHNQENYRSHPRSSKEMPNPASAPYIKQAYFWLMQNLSNPYPPKEVREAIARKTGSETKHVENWFGDARKRMGWNAICKRHFSNKRYLTVAAATAFFCGQSSELLTDMVRQDFATMSVDAEDMYSKRFIESNLARHIDSIIGSPRDKGSQSASVGSASSSSPCYTVLHSSLPREQRRCRKRSRSPDLTVDTLDTINSKKRPRLSYSGERSSALSPSSLPTMWPQSQSPDLHVIPATAKKSGDTSESEECPLPRHSSIDSRSASLRTVSNSISTSCDSSSSSSTLPSDALDGSITSQHAINEVTKRSNLVGMASFQRLPTLHSSTLSLPHNILLPSISLRKENTQLPIELQSSVPCNDSVVRQGFGLPLPDSDVTHDTLFQGSTIDDNFLAISSSEFTSWTLPSAEDANNTSWPAIVANTQTDGQIFGSFDSLPMELSFTAHVDASPALTDVDLSFGNLFDLDAGATFPPSDLDVDNMLSMTGVDNSVINDLLSLTPAVENSMAKLLQLEQLKKRKNRIQEYINLLEHQIVGTLVA